MQLEQIVYTWKHDSSVVTEKLQLEPSNRQNLDVSVTSATLTKAFVVIRGLPNGNKALELEPSV